MDACMNVARNVVDTGYHFGFDKYFTQSQNGSKSSFEKRFEPIDCFQKM